MADDPVLVERRGAVALITLNRPQRRNTINYALSKAFCDAVAAAQDARCIVVTGADLVAAGNDLAHPLGMALGDPSGDEERRPQIVPVKKHTGGIRLPSLPWVHGKALKPPTA